MQVKAMPALYKKKLYSRITIIIIRKKSRIVTYVDEFHAESPTTFRSFHTC